MGPAARLKPHLGNGYARLVEDLQAAVDARYALSALGAREPYAPHGGGPPGRRERGPSRGGVATRGDARHLGITLQPLILDPLDAGWAARLGAVAP